MKRIFFASACILFIGCTKQDNIVAPAKTNAEPVQKSSVAADTYLPLGAGTNWKYRITQDNGKFDKSKLTVMGITKKINGKMYQKVKSVRDREPDTLYYAQDNHDYYIYTNSGTSEDDDVSLEILFLKDNAAVGSTWSVSAGSADGVTLKCFGKIITRDTSITVSGVTYNNVIHSYVEIRKPLFFTYIVVNKQDFYVAENIGIVKNVSNILLPEASSAVTDLLEYKIKD